MSIHYPLLKSQGVKGTPTIHRSSVPSHRNNLVLCLLPLALLGAACAATSVQRLGSRGEDQREGIMARADACSKSGKMIEMMTGNVPTTFEAESFSGCGVRHHATVKEWEVYCETADGDFALRIDALTQRVYAINRIDKGISGGIKDNSGYRLTPSTIFDPDERSLTYVEAERRARYYASLIGLRSSDLEIVRDRSDAPTSIASAYSPDWNFVYQIRIAANAKHPLMISLRRKGGQLERLWNHGYGFIGCPASRLRD